MATLKEKAKKVSEQVTAGAIEKKKTVRSRARTAKSAADKAMEQLQKDFVKAAANAEEMADAVGAIVEDQAAAIAIEMKKGASKAKRGAKKAISDPAEQVMGDLKAAADDVKLADEIAKGRKSAARERKKAEGKAKVDETVETLKTPARKVAAARLNIHIQSPLGGVITPEEISARVPKEATDVYVRVDENKLYWVGPDGVGNVEIWE